MGGETMSDVAIKKFRKYNSDITIVEFNPNVLPSQLVFGEKDKLEPLSEIKHPWFDSNGYHEVAKINAGFIYSSVNGVSEHLGWSLKDHAFPQGKPNVGVECFLTKDNDLKIEMLDSVKAESLKGNIKWGGSFSFALLINGKKNFMGSEHFPHFNQLHPRSIKAQKPNKNIAWITVDGRGVESLIEEGKKSKGITGEQCAQMLLELGYTDAVNMDGGDSSILMINSEQGMKFANNPSGETLRNLGSVFILYSRQKVVLEIPTITKKKELAIDIGHGENTYRETGSKGVPAMAEFEFNNKVGEFARELAEHNGFDVLLTQPLNGRDTPLINRTNLANKENADILISFHADANNSPDANGHWAFYWHTSKNGKRLAEIWLKYAKSIMKNNSRGIKPSVPKTWTNFHMVRETKMVALLCEHDFMTSPIGIKNLLSDDFRRRCAETSIRAACEYFGMSFSLPDGYYGSVSKDDDNEDYEVYTVKSGDFLYKISAQFNTTVDNIRTLNNLTTNVINVGQKLKVNKKVVAQPTPTPTPKPVPIPVPAPKKKSKHFNDIPESMDWAVEYADLCFENDIIKGDGKGNLNPEGSVSRIELVAVAARLIKLKENNK